MIEKIIKNVIISIVFFAKKIEVCPHFLFLLLYGC
nr:MAG TPA: hypothetical protein [Caudoviricetes sp.]